ncbi:MAG: NAD(P)-dependent oxidoreductase [Alicyclobacillus sp.]|nr:NAD(P)-dependent oxidoreductase [Alicyclobacillus sp.]
MEDTVLVVGGAGFIGAHIARELIQHGYRVIVYDQSVPREGSEVHFVLRSVWEKVSFVPGNILDLPTLVDVIQRHSVNKVVHGAAVNDVWKLRERPYDSLTTNLQGTLHVLEAARLLKVQRVVYLSSISVYAPKQYEPMDEFHPVLHPSAGPSLLSYSVAKAAGELMGLHYWADQGVSVVSLRLSGVYGFGMKYPMYIKPMVENAVRSLPTRFEHGGPASRDFIHVLDVARAVRLALAQRDDALTSRIYNIASGDRLHTVWDIRDILLRRFPGAVIEVGPDLDAYEATVQRVRGRLSVALARKDLGFEARYPLEQGIDQYVADLVRYMGDLP